MAERPARAEACFEAGEGGSSSSSSLSSSSEAEEGLVEEGDEGGEVEKVVAWRALCRCCCFEGCGCACRFEEEEGDVAEAEEADDISGVVALSVMCMASDGCCEGRLAMLGWLLAGVCPFGFGREACSRWGLAGVVGS